MPKRIKPPQQPAPAANRSWLTVRNQAAGPTEVVISGRIGGDWWDESGLSSSEFRKAFDAIPLGTKINLRINSEGGAVKDGLEMHNIILRRAADVTGYNEGYALSSATLPLLACGKVVCPSSSLTMIHEPWGGTVGNEDDHRRAADMLAKHGDTIAGIYARRTGKPLDEMRAAMRAESWFTGEEALDFGLSDECEEMEEEHEEEAAASTRNSLDLSQFKNVPEKVLVLLGRRPPRAENTPEPQRPQNTPQPNIMDRSKILAALKQAGITLDAKATDDEVLAAFNQLQLRTATPPPQNTPAPAPAPQNTPAIAPVVIDAAGVESLRKQIADANARFDAEKRTRVEAEVRRRGENRIENNQIQFYVENALRDEKSTYAAIDAMPVNEPGGRPLPIGTIQVFDSRIEQIRKMPKALDRYSAVKDEWEGLIQNAIAMDRRGGRGEVMNANTYSATLVTSFLADGFVTKLQNRWAPLKSFARDFSTDRLKPLAAGQVKFVTAGATTQTDATNFETSADSTVDVISITPHQYTQGFAVSNTDLNSGLRMENLIEVNTAALADKILAVAFVPVTTAVFTGDAITSAPAAFSWTEMATAWGQLKKSSIRNAILDGEYMARLLNNPAYLQAALSADGSGAKAFGWDGVHLNTNWTGAGSNVRGFFCNPQAICALSGLPLTPPEGIPGNTLQEKTIVVPDINIPIAAYNWFSLGSRTLRMSYDLIFGVAAGDTTAGFILKSA
jgi:ATP-dependent protease ClpP protease subunit